MSVTGNWDLTIKAPTGPMQTTLELREENGTLRGTQAGQGEVSEISEVTMNGNEISWVNQINRPMKMKLEFTGTLEGDAMSGKVKAGMMGKFPFTATRA